VADNWQLIAASALALAGAAGVGTVWFRRRTGGVAG
jgi:hypothetical protein